MKLEKVGSFHTAILDFISKHINQNDIFYLLTNLMAEHRTTGMRCEITDSNLEDTYILDVTLTKRKGKKSWPDSSLDS